ncbi:MAG: hypothetical protein IKR86_09905 [Candidatus Methanomethylophilaceae archaeon]|nr:hypothetical protein [Candidatus Methanomethylophilaceae archaeon]
MKDHWCALSVCVIVVVALLLRTVFAYGISADNDFALSGGSGAQYHLHVIESILNGSYAIGADSAVNYPVGGLFDIPPLLDFIAAGVASFTTPSAALGGLNPVIGALTCIPVYLVAKEMFGNKTIGVVAALIFAFLPLPIASSAFSNGNEYALAAFLVAFMSFFMFRAARALDDEDGRKTVIINSVVAGVFMGLAALTWNGFGVLIAVAAAAMVVHIAVRRIMQKDMVLPYMAYAIMMVIGLAMAAIYYIPAGLWDAVFSGPCLLVVLACVFGAVFVGLRKISWVITIPALIIAMVVVLGVLYLAAADLFDALIGGNSVYSALMKDVVDNHVSMSNVASYYGWVTMWLPLCLAIYETYVFVRKDRSSARLFVTVWLYMMFFAVWASYGTAAAIGCVFGVGSAAALVKLVQYAKLGDWWSDMKAAGFPKAFRKMVSPIPFATVIVVAFLVIVPNFVYALDAGVPTNDSDNILYNGNTQFTIKTGDSYPVDDVWSSFDVDSKSGALISRQDYTYDANTYSGFKTVSDTVGNGSPAISHTLLSNGSSGALSSMILRIMMSNKISDFESDFSNPDVFNTIKNYSENSDALYNELRENAEYYGDLKSNVTHENAMYFACTKCMTDKMSIVELANTYDKVCDRAGEKISYVLLDPSMIALQYGSGDHFSSIAYFADYAIDGYGAAPQFYTYNPYYGYTVYTDKMYDTFLWKAYIGPSASQAGQTSSYGYLYALSASDGTVAASPVGMAGFSLEKWIVRYTAEKNPTADSSWKYMDYSEAIAKQKSEGGCINYLSSYMMYQYTGVSGATSITGKVVSDNAKSVDGLTAELYTYNSEIGKDVLVSSDTVKSGQYSLVVPEGNGGYTVLLKSGSVELAAFKNAIPPVYTVPTVDVTGQIVAGDNPVEGNPLKIVFQNSDITEAKYSVDSDDGSFNIPDMIEGQYKATVYDSSAASVGTSTFTVAGDESNKVSGLSVAITTRNITATVKDSKGVMIDGGSVVATNVNNGLQYSADIKEGTAVVKVPTGTYSLQLAGGYVTELSTTYTISSSNRTATITAYPAEEVSVSGSVPLTFSAGSFSAVSYDGKVSLPKSMGTDEQMYTVYGLNGGKVVLGTYDGTLTTSEYAACKVTGVLKDSDGATSGSVLFVNSEKQTVKAVAGEDGIFTVYLPAGTYTLFANDGSSTVAIVSKTVSADVDLGDITLEDGRRITSYIRYASGTSSSNIGLGYVTAKAEFTYKDVAYTIYGMTNSSGQWQFYMPDSTEGKVIFNDGAIDNEMFYGSSLSTTVASGTANTTVYVTISQYKSTSTPSNYVKQVSVTPDYSMTLVPYSSGDDVNLTAGQSANVNPGQYTAKITTPGKYNDSTVYIYPGQAELVGLDVMDAHEVTITKGDSDTVTIESDEDAKYFKDGNVYHFKDGHVYYISSVSGASATSDVKYATVDLTSGTAPTTLDMTANIAPMTITGYIGVAADGYVTVTSGDIGIRSEITSGQFSVKMPYTMTSATFTAEADHTYEGKDYTYSGSRTVPGLVDGTVVNIPVTGEGIESVDEDATMTAVIDSANFSDGNGTVVLTIGNKSSRTATYVVSAGSAWSLTKAVSATIDADSTKTVTVTGFYDDKIVAVGSDGMEVIVTNISDSSSKTLEITKNSATHVGTKGVTILTSGERSGEHEGSLDKVSAVEYMYAVTMINNDDYAKEITFTLPSASGWSVLVSDEDGYTIRESGGSFTLYGLETAVFYVKYMPNGDATGTTVPSSTVTVNYDGTSKTLNMTPSAVDVSVNSMTASGDNIFNERSGVPVGIWFMLAVGILLLIAVFWLGSKRGVFSRR